MIIWQSVFPLKQPVEYKLHQKKHVRFGFKEAWILFQHSTEHRCYFAADGTLCLPIWSAALSSASAALQTKKKVIKIGIESTHTTPTKGKRAPDEADPQ